MVYASRLLTEVRLFIARRQATEFALGQAANRDWDVMRTPAIPYAEIHPTDADPTPWLENKTRYARLPDPLRLESLRRLLALVRERGVRLALIHPSYPVSKPHRCLLTRLAQEEGVPLLETIDALYAHAAEQRVEDKRDYFLPNDYFHLNPRGHAVLAGALRRFLVAEGLVP